MVGKIPEWAYPLLGMAGAAVSDIVLFKTVNARLTGSRPIFQAPGYPYALQYNDDNIINQAIGIGITLFGLAKKNTKALGFGLGWTLEEFIGKFVKEAKNAGVFGPAGEYVPISLAKSRWVPTK